MPGIIPPEVVEQVRHATDIVDLIGSYVPLKKAGAKYKALSPFNKEKTPSFFVDPGRQMFKCFSSGHGGDVFKFLMLHENMTFPEAVRRLAQRAGIVIPEGGDYDPRARSQKEELHALYVAVAAWWQKLLKNDPAAEPARAYLKSRDFPETLAEEFGLGYAPEGWDTTLKWAQKNGYSLEALETGRLIATSESGRRFDFFRGRLMIPIHDESGQVVAFSGRLLDPEAKAQKYVNSHETPIFVKSRILFGLNKTKRSIIEAESAILCEGQIDLMRCWQKGVRNVVAPQGTAFTDQQARILKRLAKEVVICFDADNAGQTAAQRAIDVLLKEGLQVRIARIPPGEDPDSLLRKQPVTVFETILREAKDYTRHLLDTACEQEDITSPRGRGAIAQKIAVAIAKIPNAVQRESFLIEVARRLQVPRAAIEEEVRKAEAQLRRAESFQNRAQTDPTRETADGIAEAEPPEPLQPDKLVETLLSLLLNNPDLVPQVSRRLNPAWLENLDGAEVLLQLLDAHAHDAWQDAAQFLDECDDRARDYLSGLLMEPIPTPTESTLEAYTKKLVQNFDQRWKQQRLQFLNLAVKSDELSVEERMKYLREIQEIRRQFHGLGI
ncbi:MAG: DNA primase [Methylacidiphilales bacterium]|nr:DNA primase [Candidatus Methylacidiphilales bacterium]